MLIEIPDALVKEYQEARRVHRELMDGSDKRMEERQAHRKTGDLDSVTKMRNLSAVADGKAYDADRNAMTALGKISCIVIEILNKSS